MNISIGLIVIYCGFIQTVTCNSNNNYTENQNGILSRRKRFITFPEGSSLQLVFCTQSPIIMPIGDIVQFSETIALAWALPQNFKFLKDIKHEDYLDAQRRSDKKHIYYLDENGHLLAKVPYQRKPIVNPAFAKRSIDSVQNKHVDGIDKKNMHQKQTARNYLKSDYMDANTVQLHRDNRVELYGKLEKLFEAAGYTSGRQCVLKKLCEASKVLEPQATFFDELLKAVFTFPKQNKSTENTTYEYDNAYESNNYCEEMYKDC